MASPELQIRGHDTRETSLPHRSKKRSPGEVTDLPKYQAPIPSGPGDIANLALHLSEEYKYIT